MNGLIRNLVPLALSVLGAAPALAQDITLRVGDNLPTTHFLSEHGIQYFMDEVKTRSDGRVAFQYFPAQQVGKASDMLQLVQTGVVDIGLILSAYVSDKMPLTGVMDLPGTYDSSCSGTRIYARLTGAGGFLDEADFADNDVRNVFAFVNPPYQLFLAEKGVTSMQAVKGLKLRSPGGPLDSMIQKIGGVPIQMTSPEVYESLSRGTIDGLVFPPPTILSYDLQGLIGSATRAANFGNTAIAYSMNRDKWDALPEDIRAIIDEVGQETSEKVCAYADGQMDAVYGKFADNGVTSLDIAETDRAALDDTFARVREEWAATLDRQGRAGTDALTAFEAARRDTGS